MWPRKNNSLDRRREREIGPGRSIISLQTQITVVLTYHWYHQLSNGRVAVAITITKIQNDDPIDSIQI